MDRAEKIGGSAAHDQRREGAVTPPSHNLKRGAGTPSASEARLADPDRPHGEPSGRELRRAEEREERQKQDAEERQDREDRDTDDD
jgi:hypothetical protein